MRRIAVTAVVGGCLLAACTTQVPVIEIQAQPSPPASSPSPSPSGTPSPSDTPSPTGSPSPTETVPREATDTDRARFVAAFQPDGATSLQHVATDLDGDGTEELLFAYVRGGQRARVDVAWWTGTTYQVDFSGDGGTGTSIDRLRAADVNGDGLTEIITSQAVDGVGVSVSVWQVTEPRRVVPLVAAGGCHDGSNTYGASGVSFEDRDADGADEIYATCPDDTTDRYRWEAGVYRHAPSLVP